MQFAIELGAVGFALGAVLAWRIGRKAVWAASQTQDDKVRLLAVACIGAFSAIGVHSFVDFNLYVPANAMMLAWICGLCASLDMQPAEPD